ncbi:hypothetical protein [Aquitalea sp. LB_tupeE]|uniref:hypothetical protein n=1 Tax=Aquitalea sp. LB_tupeE TaxID=2748078 RepID=UPI0015BE563D|nr:hypothetical protein [Aquitalea sp. LB_tupeE]NWK77218.1 hypothetical protein [Aquitalea sp. LB_tupeE]
MPDQYYGKEVIHWEDLPRLTENGLPPKAYYSLDDAAGILKCRPIDVLHYAATERLDVVASAESISVAAVLTLPDDYEFDPNDKRQEGIEFIALNAGQAREVELKGETSMHFAFWGYSVNNPIGVYGAPPWEIGYGQRGSYRFFSLVEIVDEEDFSEGPLDQITITMRSIYVMAVSLYRFKLGLLQTKEDVAKKLEFSGLNAKPRRQDGMARVVAALAAGYLGSTDDIGSKANQILDGLVETQNRGGLEGLQLPDVKTLRGYLKQAQDQIKR